MAVLIARRPRQLLLLLSLVVAGCGGGANHATPPPQRAPQRDYTNYYPPGTHRTPRAIERIIRHWSDQLRAGNVRSAAADMDLGVIVQNATPPMRLTSRRQILAWNAELPCGAHVVKLITGKSYTVATFVLTERPGSPSGCGSTGKLAATAFLIRHGKIAEWRRVLVPPPMGPPGNLRSVPAS